MKIRKLLVVSLGGIVGSLARWGFSLLIVSPGFPWATLGVNYVGSVLLMAIVIYTKHHESPGWWWRPALGTGFCGGFTTYSAFALKVDQDFKSHSYLSVGSYVLVSLVGTFILVFLTYEVLDTRWSRK